MTSAGRLTPSGSGHGAGATFTGVGFGGGGCTIVLPNAGGVGRESVGRTRWASDGAWSTRGTPNGG
ncbi:MAG TPA: hypothetical protein VIM54_00415, partial [Lacisediminihabitans sp.]